MGKTKRADGGAAADSNQQTGNFGRTGKERIGADGKVSGFKKGGKVVAGANERGKAGIGFRLPVQHSGNKDDTQNIGRKSVITRATGGPIYANGKAGKDMGPDLGGGSKGGTARIEQAKRAERTHG